MPSSQAARMIEEFLFETASGYHFTQRSPIYLDVWIRYGVDGPKAQDLLLVSNSDSTGVILARTLKQRMLHGLSNTEQEAVAADAQIAPTQSAVAARLDFASLMRAALPLSRFFHDYLLAVQAPKPPPSSARAASAPRSAHVEACAMFKSPGAFAKMRPLLRRALLDLRRTIPDRGAAKRPRVKVLDDLAWLARAVGGMQLLFKLTRNRGAEALTDKKRREWQNSLRDPDRVLDAFYHVMAGVQPDASEVPPLWSVHRNRAASIALYASTATVKADAAHHVFGVKGRDIRWAVLDTGIDARHYAFRRRDRDGKALEPAFLPPNGAGSWKNQTRILETYDFTCIRQLMSASLRGLDNPDWRNTLPEWLRSQLMVPSFRSQVAHAIEVTHGSSDLADEAEAKELLRTHSVNWDVWRPVLQIPHTETGYRSPPHDHGTHVAGIIAADWRSGDSSDDVVVADPGLPQRSADRVGVAPQIELYDVRVLDQNGLADEFTVLAALQFVRSLNAQHEHVQIHGINLSLSLVHQVANFACGCTPVCEECERAVQSGMVVVAAAGNLGRAQYLQSDGGYDEGYRTVSITDPGNAPSVITVGATHRQLPHMYGVSYFSSRGPTADGRLKPDLVAPGEKITSTIPSQKEASLDGTSMAAPHVSGAAALLLCRYPEYIGQPAQVKRILCATATDLGRDRYFQGAGLLDILRALQSI